MSNKIAQKGLAFRAKESVSKYAGNAKRFRNSPRGRMGYAGLRHCGGRVRRQCKEYPVSVRVERSPNSRHLSPSSDQLSHRPTTATLPTGGADDPTPFHAPAEVQDASHAPLPHDHPKVIDDASSSSRAARTKSELPPHRPRRAGDRRQARLVPTALPADRRTFIGGSDARIVMGKDEAALLRLWREKRGEAEPQDLSGVLIVQLGHATEDLNRRWYEAQSGNHVTDIQARLRHPVHTWMGATLDGRVDPGGAVFEAKFMLPWSFSEQAAAEKHMAQLQHNMWVANARSAALSIITGGGQWVQLTIHADPLYQHLLLTAEKKFWRCVQSGEEPRLFGIDPPRPRLAAIRVVDMTASPGWEENAALYRATFEAHREHETAKTELKQLMPEDAKEAVGHGLRGKRSKSGAVSFDLLDLEEANAPGQ